MEPNLDNVKRLAEALKKARLHELLEVDVAKAEAEARAYAELDSSLVATLQAWLADPARREQVAWKAKSRVEGDPDLVARLDRLFATYGVNVRLE